MNTHPYQLLAFDITAQLIWQKISIPVANQAIYSCDEKQFYLAISGIARFLALPHENRIIIEKLNPDIENNILNTWLYGTVMAYILQYHGYLVLHGSAVMTHDKAMIFSGQSGAGKSTLAGALVQKGYPFITDDLVVIKRNEHGQYCLIPGPTKLKLWQDAMQHFNFDTNHATQVSLKANKYAVQVEKACNASMIPIASFYELNINQNAESFCFERLNTAQSLKTLMQNAYRYFMLKPLGKLQTFFQDCSALNQQIAVHKITRTPNFDELPRIIQRIEVNQGIVR